MPPPTLDSLRYGDKLIAGMGQSTCIADIDFETYSPAGFVWNNHTSKWDAPHGAKDKGLKTTGVAVYSEHTDAEVICLAYNLKYGQERGIWMPGQPLPYALMNHVKNGNLIEAWNVTFEFYIWNNICVKKYGFPPLKLEQVRCAAAKSRAHSLPGSLEPCGQVLNIPHKKDQRGKRLIQLYCIPRTPTKYDDRRRLYIADNVADKNEMLEYNLRDIEAEFEISMQVPDLSESELLFWQIDQRINQRGIRIDIKSVNACIKIIEQAYSRFNSELPGITKGKVTAATQVQRIKDWMMEYGVHSPSLDEDSIEQLLKLDIAYQVRRVLEIRQILGSAAVKKLYAMKHRLSRDGRVKELFMYHGAHTGRHSGAGIQPQNMPKGMEGVRQCKECNKRYDTVYDCPWCGSGRTMHTKWDEVAIADALEIAQSANYDCFKYYFNGVIGTIGACLRSLFIAADNHDLICSDYKAIEGICIACLAGEKWRIEVFRTHGLIYEMSAAKIFRIPLQEFIDYYNNNNKKHHPRRAAGKVAELAYGFQGWIKAALKFGADEFMSEQEIKDSIIAWREASPMIVKLWERMQYCAMAAVDKPGCVFEYRGISFITRGDVLYCRLLSGRYLTYHRPRLNPSSHPNRQGQLELSYEGWNNTSGWQRINTYGGSLTENIVQATARDILAHAIVNLEQNDYPVVLHVHDEIVCEIPEGFGSVETVEAIMADTPHWAKEWPIKAADGWRSKRYKK